MPEISLNLLKEKIIKTDTVITLLADKNEKISQLREKLKQLYHKYMNRLKECEVLQLKIDLCKLEHEPLQANLKVISEKYQNLQAEYEKLSNVSQIRYQTKCKELEEQLKKYRDLSIKKQQCDSCEELNMKYDSVCKKYDKLNKQFNKLSEKYKEEQEITKNIFSNSDKTEQNYANKLKCLKEEHANEVSKLQDNIVSIQLSKQKLEEEIVHLNNKVDFSISQVNENSQCNNHIEDLGVNNSFNDENVNTCTEITNNLEDEEFEYILNVLSSYSIPSLLSPISEDLDFGQVNETVQEPSKPCNNLNEDAVLSDAAYPHSDRTTSLYVSEFETLHQSLIDNCSEEYSDDITNLELDNADSLFLQHDHFETDVAIHNNDGANELIIDNRNIAGEKKGCIINNIDFSNNSDSLNINSEVSGGVELNIEIPTADEQKCTTSIRMCREKNYIDCSNLLKTIIDCHRKSLNCNLVSSTDNNLLGFSASHENILSHDTIKSHKAEQSLVKRNNGNINISHEERRNTPGFGKADDICTKVKSDLLNNLQYDMLDDMVSHDDEKIYNESVGTQSVEDSINENFVNQEETNYIKDNCKSVGAVCSDSGNESVTMDIDVSQKYDMTNTNTNYCMENSIKENCTLQQETTFDKDNGRSVKAICSDNCRENGAIDNNVSQKYDNCCNENKSKSSLDANICIPTKEHTEVKGHLLKHMHLNISEDKHCNNKADNIVCNRYKDTDNTDLNIIENLHLQYGEVNPLMSKALNCSPNSNIVNNYSCSEQFFNLKFTGKHYSNNTASTVNKIINYQKESNRYFFRTTVGDDILGFRKETDIHVQKNRKKVLRNRGLFLNKMKQELYISVVRYINRKIKLSSLSNFPKKCHSTKFKNIRKQQMLRWRRFRELYLSNTDTDSDYSKKFNHSKRKVKNKSQTLQEVTVNKSENPQSSISEDEHMIRQIFKEEHKYQTLISDHKALEDFYHMSTDNDQISQAKEINTVSQSLDDSNKSSSSILELRIDKDDSNNDSGYFKSDSDYASKINRRKRTRENTIDSVRKRKCILTNGQDNKTCDVNLEINLNKLEDTCVQSKLRGKDDSSIDGKKENTLLTKCLNNVISENVSHDSISINDKATSTENNITTEIYSLFDQAGPMVENGVTGNSSALENSIDLRERSKNNCENGNDLEYLFGSDCESIFSSDVENDTANAEVDNTKSDLSSNSKKNHVADAKEKIAYSRGSNIQHKMEIKEETLNSIKNSRKNDFTQKIGTLKRYRTRLSKIKSPLADSKRKMRTNNIEMDLNVESENISRTEGVSPENDPLYVRLKQENISRTTRNKSNSNNIAQSSYKKSNSIRKQVRLLVPPPNPLDIIIEAQNTKVVENDNAVLKKPRRLTQAKARILLNKLLTFPDKQSISDEVAEAFAGEEHGHIFRIFIHELSLDVGTPNTKYTPPAPVLTETQRVILGLLVKLDRTTSTGLLETFMLKTEKYILTLGIDKMHMLGRVTRLYLAICKLQRKIHRMRRMVCDSFYFMGDLSVPFLFTVLSTWTEVMLHKSELNDEPLISVIIEIIKKKTCVSQGYNLFALKKLLEVYYGYSMGESNMDELFEQIINAYTEIQSKKLEYAILILCKNNTKSWVVKKIQLHMKPIIDNGKDIILKQSIVMLVSKITKDFNSVEMNELSKFEKLPD